VLAGKGRREKTVYYDPDELFVVNEVLPAEVVHDIESKSPTVEQGRHVVAGLLQDGALRVELIQDTVLSSMGMEMDTERKLTLFGERLVSYVTLEKYDLCILATEDDGLLASLAEKSKSGSALLGVKSEHLNRTRLLHDKITEIANWDRPGKIVMEN
jgi:hypothetical protein